MDKINKIKKAVILVAGYGTRFLPATKAIPKEMLPLVDKPVIQFLVEEIVASGLTDIIFVTSKGKRAIEDHFDYALELEEFLRGKGKRDLAEKMHRIADMAHFSYVRQKEPLGTADAILAAKDIIHNEPFAVLYGDDIVISDTPCLRQLIDVYAKFQAPVLALERVPKKEVSRYGVIDGERIDPRLYKVKGLVEKPSQERAPSNLIRIGKSIFTPELLSLLAHIKRPKSGEFYDVFGIAEWIRQGNVLYGYEYEGVRYDCGEKLGYLKAVVQAGLQHPEVGKEFKKYLIDWQKKRK
ncbi:MAG: UTP--glucose-1-phosphate uridylyltransferase [Parcubacteria group bacterium Gr01-1014_33]|nr:MAG: UTP--glucose-1-phosphate uridylyltransferase [Parcubacteria group bacterium Gr01-1014_33]